MTGMLFSGGLAVLRTVLTARLAPALLLIFAITWPLADFPIWPLLLTFGTAIVLRIVGFGDVITGKRGPVVLVALLIASTLYDVSPWMCGTGLGLGLTGVGLHRLPRWPLLAAAWCSPSDQQPDLSSTRSRATARETEQWRARNAHDRANMLPRGGIDVVNTWMTVISRGDTTACTALFSAAAQKQLAQAYQVADCPAAVRHLHDQVDNAHKYGGWPRKIKGKVVSTHLSKAETVRIDACKLYYTDIHTGDAPLHGPQPGRLVATLELNAGHRITEYHQC